MNNVKGKNNLINLSGYEKLAIATLLATSLGFLTPFNYSHNILRFLSTHKVYLYFSATVFIHHFYIRNDLIWKIPGLWIMSLVLISEGVSTYLGQLEHIGDFWFLYSKEVSYVFFCIACIIVFSSFSMLRTFYLWKLNIGVVSVLLSMTKVINLSDILPHSISSVLFQDLLRSTTSTIGIDGVDVKRGAFLWMDANNLAHFLSSLIVILFYFLLTDKRRKRLNNFRIILMFLFVFSLGSTVSRGGVLCTIVAMLVLVMLFIKAKLIKTKAFPSIIIILVIVYGVITSIPSFQVLKKRFLLSTGLVGNTQVYYEMTGLETGRLRTARIAYEEFLENPLLGKGIGFRPGRLRVTGNHLGYLNILCKYGIIGFVLQFLVLWFTFSRLMWATRYLKANHHESFTLGYLILSLMSATIVGGFFMGIHIIGLCVMPAAFFLAVYKEYRGNPKNRQRF